MKRHQLICTVLSLSFCIMILLITMFGLEVFKLSELYKQEYLAKIRHYEMFLKKRGFTNKQIRDMSPLGKWLLAPEGSPPPNMAKNRTFLISFKIPPILESRNITWEHCSVKNCIVSYNKNYELADAIVEYLHIPWEVLETPDRRPDQLWIFMAEEHAMYKQMNPLISNLNGVYNWSMTYLMDSDIPIPYGRTIQRSQPASENFRQRWKTDLKATKTKLVAIWDEDCNKDCKRRHREFYVSELRRLLENDLDIGGNCWTHDPLTLCSGKKLDCPALNAYKFYLAFEHCNCHEYLSKEIFLKAYQKNAVPIIMGPSLEDCRRLLPPNSYLHVDDFKNLTELAVLLKELDRDDERYMRYHEWRDNYIVTSKEHNLRNYYCRVCEALNYNQNTPKVYNDLDSFWRKSHCT